MNRSRFKRLLALCFLLAGVVGLSGWLILREQRQEQLDRALLRVVYQDEYLPEVRALLDRGADPNASSPYDQEGSLYETLLFLLGRGPKEPIGYFPTPLIGASMNGAVSVAKLLLDRGAKVNARSHIFGETALTSAASAGEVEVVKLLLARGADVNAREKDGTTALQAATKQRHGEVARLLKQAGATK